MKNLYKTMVFFKKCLQNHEAPKGIKGINNKKNFKHKGDAKTLNYNMWIDNKIIKGSEAKIHLLNQTIHYGAGVFEGIRCYSTSKGPAIFRLKDHMKRLIRSAAYYKIKTFPLQTLARGAREVVKQNKFTECYIRPLVYLEPGKMGMEITETLAHTMIAAWPWGTYLGSENLEKGVNCMISRWRRIDSKQLPVQAKACGNYVNSIQAKIDAVEKGFHEAIMLNMKGNVAEGPGENIFIVKNNELLTPPLTANVLDGITRKSIMTIAREEGFKTKEQNITPKQLLNGDEAFFTGTAIEVMPITRINNKKIGKGKIGTVTKQLQQSFFKEVHGKGTHKEWLDQINK